MQARKICKLLIIAFLKICSIPTLVASEIDHDKFQIRLQKAEQLFNASLFEDAIPIYQEIMKEEAQNELMQHHIRYHLAQAFFQINQYNSIVDLLEDQTSPNEASPQLEEVFQNEQLLLSLAYTKIGSYNKAIPILEKYAKLKEEALLELGLSYYFSNECDKARNILETLPLNKTKTSLFILSRFYLARISLFQKKLVNAEKHLNEAISILSSEDPLWLELAYLQGELFFQSNSFLKAAESFEKALPKRNQEKVGWTQDTLYQLGWSYLKIANDATSSPSTTLNYFEKAETTFKRLLEISSEEKTYLALAQFYLIRAAALKNEKDYQEAEQILSVPQRFTSKEAQTHALLLRAQAAPFYTARDKFYRQLTKDSNQDSPHYGEGLFLRGLNDYGEGEAWLIQEPNEAQRYFNKAIESMQKAFEFLKKDDKAKAGLAIKYQAQALQHLNRRDSQQLAISLIEDFLDHYRDIFEAMTNPDELLYIYALILLHLSDTDPRYVILSEEILQTAINRYPDGKFADANLHLLGMTFFKQQRYDIAETSFVKLAKEFPDSLLAGEALFWAANAAEKQKQDRDKIRSYRQLVFEKYPNSPHADEAYFLYYTYRDYVQGDRTAIKHLQALPQKWPESPYVLNTYYLMGLDLTRDRKSPEGRSIRKKNLIAAIDAFQEVETNFDKLIQRGVLDDKKMDYYVHLRYRSVLERALANLGIADESEGAKKEIYLEYAEEVFKQLLENFSNSQNVLYQYLKSNELYPQLEEEASFGLAQTYIKGKQDIEAEKVLSNMLEKYRSAKITRGYYLSRVKYELGLMSMRRQDPSIALLFYLSAEDAAKGKVLSTDQRLDLWIQQSLCYQALNEYENAILVLSKAVNDDAVSGLRLKAMYMRAEVYEKQARFELAQKQLESITKKGGEWALQAKIKLEKEYGYQ